MISIESLKEKLSILGYELGIKGHNLLSVGKKLGSLEGYDEVFLLDFYCSVSLEGDGAYVIFYGNTMLPSSVEMSSESEVINWIKKQYPL